MALEIGATYENGVLKLDQPLPLAEHERVIVIVRPRESRIRKSAGILPCPNDPKDIEFLLGPENEGHEG